MHMHKSNHPPACWRTNTNQMVDIIVKQKLYFRVKSLHPGVNIMAASLIRHLLIKHVGSDPRFLSLEIETLKPGQTVS